MKENVIVDKSKIFAVRVQYLVSNIFPSTKTISHYALKKFRL